MLKVEGCEKGVELMSNLSERTAKSRRCEGTFGGGWRGTRGGDAILLFIYLYLYDR